MVIDQIGNHPKIVILLNDFKIVVEFKSIIYYLGAGKTRSTSTTTRRSTSTKLTSSTTTKNIDLLQENDGCSFSGFRPDKESCAS